ncbi:MAG: tetratricopeptide repeat protein [Myxococcales bacterium]|nr:tetratricopeptide repeat protein [Myxococcales bacterium]
MDKNKIIEAAAKLVAKGAYEKAIKEYQKVLDADPKDVRILQKMGELYQKKNDSVQAAQYFIRVAESYSNDGFFLKAVALYKQVLKLNPALIEVNLRLAELHQQLQLMSEAMAYYQVVANHYDKAGDTKASLDTLKKMVDLDPENVASRIKLAELYARESINKEALVEFKRAAEYLKRNNRTDDYLRVAERISALEPENLPLVRELAESYLARSDHKRALAKLQVCFKADPHDLETLKLLASAFQGLGQTSKTVSVYKELAKLYSDRGRTDDASGIWRQIEQLDPRDPDLLSRKAPAAPAPPPPEPEPAPPRHRAQPARAAAQPTRAAAQPARAAAQPARAAAQPARAAPPPEPAPPPPPAPEKPAAALGRDQLAKLLTETDVYVKYGLHEKALEHLRKIFSVDPENLDAHEKAYQIYLASNNHAQAVEQLLNVLRLCTRRAEVARAQPYLAKILQENPGHPEVPAFLAVLRSTGTAPTETAEQLPDDAILVDSSDEEIIVADAPEDALGADDVALRAAGAQEGEVVEEAMVVAEESQSEEITGAPIDEENGPTGVSPSLEDEPLSSPELSPEDLAAASAEEDSSGELILDGDEPSAGDLGAHDRPTAVHAVPSAAALRAAGYPERASEPEPEDRTDSGFRPLGSVIEPEPITDTSRMPRLGEATEEILPQPAEELAEEQLDQPFEEPAEEPAGEPPVEEEPAAEECDEAAFFLDQGLADEAREIIETILIAYPGHRRATGLMARLEALEQDGSREAASTTEEVAPPSVSPVSDSKDAFDLAAELAEELGEIGGEAAPSAGGVAGDDFQYSVEEVFSEFKKGLEKVVKPEDVDTHYDLGIAYKEMGLVDDAIGEFDVARQGCAGKKKEVDCLTMIGLLQLSKGDAKAAIDSFKQGLTSEHATGEVEKALRYELGTAHEQAGSPGRALFHFQKVHKLDPKYRDVANLVSRLSSSTKPEDDPLPPRKPGGPNGANGAPTKSGPSGGPSGRGDPSGASAKPPDPSKARKVGYV